MNQALKGPWVAALRSGEYRKGVGQLSMPLLDQDDNQVGVEFCCLGVLCEINGWEYDGDLGGIEEGPIELVGSYEDPSSCDSAEIPGVSGLTHRQRNHLADMNDGGSSFDAVASWIEENL